MRNFGISLLLFGLLLVGIDGFRGAESVTGGATTTETAADGDLHSADYATTIPPR